MLSGGRQASSGLKELMSSRKQRMTQSADRKLGFSGSHFGRKSSAGGPQSDRKFETNQNGIDLVAHSVAENPRVAKKDELFSTDDEDYNVPVLPLSTKSREKSIGDDSERKEKLGSARYNVLPPIRSVSEHTAETTAHGTPLIPIN